MNITRNIGIRLTKSTIYRYMRINGIQSITRKKKRKYDKTPLEIVPNLINRNFKATRPNQKWSIDLSYIHTGSGRLYLCAIKDMYDKSIRAHKISKYQDNLLVTSTLKRALEKTPQNQRTNLIIHSDQGVQFRSHEYKKILKQNNIKHSVSHKGVSVDNAPIESWFSALKCETLYLYPPRNRETAISTINKYVLFYNCERLQEQLGEKSPLEYRNLAL